MPSIEPLHDLLQNGFAVIDHFLELPAVENLIHAVESLPEDQQSTNIRRGVAFARRNLLELDWVQNLISRPSIQNLLDSIALGLIHVRAILFDKSGPANWTVPWHQDRSIAVRDRIEVPGFHPWSIKAGVTHVQPPVDILRQMVTLRFHLDPCGENNGPLRVIAGTHTRILDPHEIETTTAAQTQTICTTSAGGLLVMRPLLLHASSPAKQPSHRRVVHIEFGPPKLPGGLEWAAMPA